MPPRLTTEKFKENIIKIHGDRYDLSRVVYEYAHIKVTVGCYEHGDFETRPNSLQQGYGCPVCGDIQCGKSQTKTQEQFLVEMINHYSDLYDFSNSIYTKGKNKISFVCLKHGIVETTAQNLCEGNGCPKCGLERIGPTQAKTKEKFVEEAEEEHGIGTYDYSEFEYISAKDAGKIKCNRCDYTFSQTPCTHLRGCGCTRCNKSGFSQGKPASLYVLKSNETIKIGITNKRPESRLREIRMSSGIPFEKVAIYEFDDGNRARDIEQKQLSNLRMNFKSPDYKFDGYTECFVDVTQEDFIKLISKLDSEYRA
jgi:hypothetical protein